MEGGTGSVGSDFLFSFSSASQTPYCEANGVMSLSPGPFLMTTLKAKWLPHSSMFTLGKFGGRWLSISKSISVNIT